MNLVSFLIIGKATILGVTHRPLRGAHAPHPLHFGFYYSTGEHMNTYTFIYWSRFTGKHTFTVEAITAARARRQLTRAKGKSIHVLKVDKT